MKRHSAESIENQNSMMPVTTIFVLALAIIAISKKAGAFR